MRPDRGIDLADNLNRRRCRRESGWRWRSPAFVILTAVVILAAGPRAAVAAGGVVLAASEQGFTEAWKAYRAAVQRKASVSELLPLARAVYDALPEDSHNPKVQKRKAAAAFNLGMALRDNRNLPEARDHFAESARLFAKALGENAVELVDPLWEWARTELWQDGRDPRRVERLVARIDRILAAQGLRLQKLRFDLHLEWAQNYAQEGIFSRAYDHLRWVEAHTAELGEWRDFYLGQAAFLRGKMAAAQRHYSRALEDYRRARSLLTRTLPPGDPSVLRVAQFAIVALEKLGRSDEATPLCQEIGRYRKYNPDSDYIPLYRVEPEYPSRALRRRIDGKVVLELTVTAEGRTADIRVVDADPPGFFEEAAIAAARKFRYAPRYENGQPVATREVRYLFTFALANR